MTGDEFRQWRRARFRTQAEAGKAFGVSRETILRWEKGDRDISAGAYIIMGLTEALEHARACRALERDARPTDVS